MERLKSYVKEVKPYKVRTQWNWRDMEEWEGTVVGECTHIGHETNPCRSEEYVIMELENGTQVMIHESKVVKTKP